MSSLLEQLFLWAVSLSGYAHPGELPSVVELPASTLVERVCQGKFCTAVAYYDPDTETIYYDNSMSLKQDHHARSFIVHEMVHFLQHRHGKLTGKSMPCEQRILLEQQAYQIQLFFLDEHHQQTYETELALAMLPGVCE